MARSPDSSSAEAEPSALSVDESTATDPGRYECQGPLKERHAQAAMSPSLALPALESVQWARTHDSLRPGLPRVRSGTRFPLRGPRAIVSWDPGTRPPTNMNLRTDNMPHDERPNQDPVRQDDILRLARSHTDIGAFTAAYLGRLQQLFDSVDKSLIRTLADEFLRAREEDATLFVAGNGGSATTATSMGNDLGFDVLKKAEIERGFRIHPLTDSNASITAIANDVGFENVFLHQLRTHFQKGDRLIAISASGNSENLLRAARWVRDHGGKVIALLGFDGGMLREESDLALVFESAPGEYGPIEDAHLIVNHILAHWFQVKLREG